MPNWGSDEWWEIENRRIAKIKEEGKQQAYSETRPAINTLYENLEQIRKQLKIKPKMVWGYFGPSYSYREEKIDDIITAIKELQEAKPKKENNT
jgi:hypothetical protein